MATESIDVKVAGNGRMILPASVRKALGSMEIRRLF